MNIRRKLLVGFGALATLVAVPVAAQSTAKRRVGLLYGEMDEARIAHFKRGMRELGYIEGENVQYILKSPKGLLDAVPTITTELIDLEASVIVLGSVSAAQAARKVSSTIPLVLVGASDPVAAGLAMSLARPGYNVTGGINLYDELAIKNIELTREFLPKARRIGVLAIDSIPASRVLETLQVAATKLKIEMFVSRVSGPGDVPQGLQRFKGAKIDAVIVLTAPVFSAARQSLVDSAAQLHLPVISGDSFLTELGGLMNYGPNWAELFYLAAQFVDKILRGVKPSELPIQQPTRFELVVNMKTAKSLGIKIPKSILLRADRVIE